MVSAGVLVCGILTWPQAVFGQELKGFQIRPGGNAPAELDPEVTISVEPPSAKPGDTVTLSLTIALPRGAYTYSMSPKFGGGTKVKSEANVGVVAVGEFTADHPPEVEFVKEFNQNLEKYKGTVTWSRKYKIQEGAKQARLKGVLDYQMCSTGCQLLEEPYDLQIELAGANSETQKIAKRETDGTPATEVDRFRFDADLKRNKNAKVFIRLTPTTAKPGDTVTLEVHVDIAEGWHTYSISQPEKNSAQPTEISFDTDNSGKVIGLVGLEPLDADFQPSKPFVLKEVDDVVGKKKFIHQTYEHDITWTRKFRLLPDTQLADAKVKGQFLFQVCKGVCILSRVKFELPRPEGEAPAIPVGENIEPVPAGDDPTSPPATGSSVTDLSDTDCVAQSGGGDIRDRGVLHVLGVSFVFGWLALLTPCVFPMVPITVSFFLKQAEKKHNSPFKMALVYCGSIVATFTVLGLIFSALFGATSINTLANGVFLNLFLGIVLLFFAMNLLGLFDIQIPSWLLTFTASKESASSYLGVFFMALTFTLTSFTCTFAFLGLILVWSASGDFWLPLGSLMAFSTAFALPFFLLALFPSYLHKLPKSGGWMNRVKVIMGLVEMAFMLKFLSVADISWNGTPTIFDYHLVMSAWMAISIVAGMYLIGKIQLPHDTREEYVGVIPMVVAICFFGLAGYLGVGTFAPEPPGGFLGRQIAAFAPPRLQGGIGEDGPYLISAHDQQRYLLDFERAKASAKKLQQPLFVDFTGVNCVNCRLMEAKLADPSIQKHLQRFVRTQLYTDFIPDNAVTDSRQSSELLKHNQELQSEWYKNVTLPGYAVVAPDGHTILSRIQGDVPPEEFAAFLQCGLNKWQRSQQSQVASRKP